MEKIKFIKNMSKKQWLIFCIALILLIFAWRGVSYGLGVWRESILIDRYEFDIQKKQFIDQIKVNKEDLSKNPDKYKKIAATMDMGLQWYNLREWDLAAKWWRRGLNIEPNNEIGWTNLGNAYVEMKDYSEAEDAYENAMKYARPGEAGGCLALADLYKYSYTTKKNKEIDVLLKCLKKHKGDRDLTARAAGYYRDIGDVHNAIIYFDKLWSMEPTMEVGEELRDLRLKLDELEKSKK
ncbi:tetratricopeptide repeat protein [Candidatus Peregrinibacteria bacterium]|nr:tetratricopeptide repeat protein [Candidatus Peregrinibacteria bacterium]